MVGGAMQGLDDFQSRHGLAGQEVEGLGPRLIGHLVAQIQRDHDVAVGVRLRIREDDNQRDGQSDQDNEQGDDRGRQCDQKLLH